MNRRAFLVSAVLVSACASPAPARLPLGAPLVLPGSDGRTHDLRREIAQTKLAVFVFYSRTCPCLRVHEPRLETLARDYAPRGVRFFLVDSEVGATAEQDALETKARGYSFPLLTDPGAKLAKAMHAEFATHAIVVDRTFAIVYSGGLDADKNHLHPDARPYLRTALDDLLLGRPPAATQPEPLGCALELE